MNLSRWKPRQITSDTFQWLQMMIEGIGNEIRAHAKLRTFYKCDEIKPQRRNMKLTFRGIAFASRSFAPSFALQCALINNVKIACFTIISISESNLFYTWLNNSLRKAEKADLFTEKKTDRQLDRKKESLRKVCQ